MSSQPQQPRTASAGGPAQANDAQQAPAGSPVAVVPAPPAVGRGVVPWDPFALMDRLDADAFIMEMQGIATEELVYRIKDGAKEVVGLSKSGVDECCTMLVTQGQCIREERLEWNFIGEGEDKEAMFTVTAARFAVSSDGREARLDQVLGVKREALFEQRAPITLQSKVPGKKWRHLMYEQALQDQDARSYLEWIVTGSSFDGATKQFVDAILNGVDVQEFSAGKRFNPFWYEHGAMKAARNARFRLVPAGIKAQVIALAKQEQRVKEVERPETSNAEPRPAAAAPAKAASQPPEWVLPDGLDSSGFPYGPNKGVPLAAVYRAGVMRTKKGVNGAPDEVLDVGGLLVIKADRLREARAWAIGKIKRNEAAELQDERASKDDLLNGDDLQFVIDVEEDTRMELERRGEALVAEGTAV